MTWCILFPLTLLLSPLLLLLLPPLLLLLLVMLLPLLLLLLLLRYLDLHELHRVFTNGKFGRQVDYLEYLGSLNDFDALTKHERLKAPYR